MTMWFDDQRAIAEVLPRDGQVRTSEIELISQRGPQGEDFPRDSLLAMSATGRIRLVLTPLAEQTGHSGYRLIDRTGRAIAGSDDTSVGSREFASRVDLMPPILAGRSTVSRPFASEVPLPYKDQVVRLGVPTMVVAAPLRSSRDEIIGALVLRIRPEAGFTRILQVARCGESGETYAVDDRGLMLSKTGSTTRFKFGPARD